MPTERHYPNAPITEAVLDLRVIGRADLKIDDLSKVATGDEISYPTAEPLKAVTGSLMLGPETSATQAVTKQIGFVFRRNDSRYIYQARNDGFTISELPKYSSWKEFRAEAHHRWTRYRDIAQPNGIRRAALRYVNRIDVPAPLTNIEDYLRTYPSIAAALPQMTDGYFMQLGIPFEKIGARALITETIIPPAREGFVSIVLDIDTFREYPAPTSEEEAWQLLEQLRDLKNEIFEACITDKSRGLFQ